MRVLVIGASGSLDGVSPRRCLRGPYGSLPRSLTVKGRGFANADCRSSKETFQVCPPALFAARSTSIEAVY